MLLDPETLRSRAACSRGPATASRATRGSSAELPAAQLEIITSPAATVGEAVAALASARRELAAGVAGGLSSSPPPGPPIAARRRASSASGPRYDRTSPNTAHARRQLVFALQVHIASAARNARSRSTTRCAPTCPRSRRWPPTPRFTGPRHRARIDRARRSRSCCRARACRRRSRAGTSTRRARAGRGCRGGADPNAWWWELRPHPQFGTLELRVPDAQTTVSEAAAWRRSRSASSRRSPSVSTPARGRVTPTWRIAENRWWAARDGLEGQLADLVTGDRLPTRRRLHELLAEIAPAAARLGCEAQLAHAERSVQENGAMRQRAVAATKGLDGLERWLGERWLAGA